MSSEEISKNIEKQESQLMTSGEPEEEKHNEGWNWIYNSPKWHYFFRMVHIAESRLAARGIGSYARRTLQPLGGRKNRGGQRCGEMETACLIGHDAPVNLFEFLTTKSDCIDLKNQYIRQTMETDFTKEPEELSIVPESVKLLNAYITVIGIKR